MELEIELNFKKYENSNIALAVSGGADSLAMMYMVREWIFNNCFKSNVTVISVDHGLRPESKQEVKFVESHALSLGFAFKSIKWKWNGVGNLQSKARSFRYVEMSKWCKENNFSYIFVAHNANDCCETILSNLMRGSGVDGLCGIREENFFNSVKIVRPLINFTREKINRYLASKYLLALDDISNNNEKYTRVAIRKSFSFLSKLINIDDSILLERINLAGTHIRNSSNAINFYVDKEFAKHVKKDRFFCFEIDRDILHCLPLEISQRILIKIFSSLNSKFNKPRLKDFNKFLLKIFNVNELKLPIAFEECIVFFIKDKNSLYFCRDWKFIVKSCFLREKETLWDGRIKFVKKCNDKYRGLDIEVVPVGKYASNICNELKLKEKRQVVSSLPLVLIGKKVYGSPIFNEFFELKDVISCLDAS